MPRVFTPKWAAELVSIHIHWASGLLPNDIHWDTEVIYQTERFPSALHCGVYCNKSTDSNGMLGIGIQTGGEDDR